MTKSIKRILLVANFILLFLVAYLGVKIVNGQATQVATERIQKICMEIIPALNGDGSTVEDARKLALVEMSVGDYIPFVEITRENEDVILETDDQSLLVAAKDVPPDGKMRVNCNSIAKEAG